jgi:hypothetical protein
MTETGILFINATSNRWRWRYCKKTPESLPICRRNIRQKSDILASNDRWSGFDKKLSTMKANLAGKTLRTGKIMLSKLIL